MRIQVNHSFYTNMNYMNQSIYKQVSNKRYEYCLLNPKWFSVLNQQMSAFKNGYSWNHLISDLILGFHSQHIYYDISLVAHLQLKLLSGLNFNQIIYKKIRKINSFCVFLQEKNTQWIVPIDIKNSFFSSSLVQYNVIQMLFHINHLLKPRFEVQSTFYHTFERNFNKQSTCIKYSHSNTSMRARAKQKRKKNPILTKINLTHPIM